MTKEELERKKEELEENLNSISLDFLGDHALEDDFYISDAFSEYADSATSIYYSDQFNFYKEHSTECEDALLEYMDGDSIADYIKKEGLYNLCCHAGALGEYQENLNQLYENESGIKKLLVIRYLLKNDIYDISERVFDLIMDECDFGRSDETSELLDNLNNYMEDEKNEL